MVAVKPFKGIRYNLEKTLLKNVIAPPYDVISQEMKDALSSKSPYNVVRLILPDGEQEKYSNASYLYNQWKSEEVLVKEKEQNFYIYEQEYDYLGKTYVRTGFIGLMKLEELGKGKVFPHEKTLSGPKRDRLELMKACSANFSQIFGLYLDKENKMEKIFSHAKKNMPAASAVDVDGVKNSIWTLKDSDVLDKITQFMKDKAIYIADGHHRYETALNYKNYMRETNNISSDEIKPYDYIMMMFVNFYDEGLKIFPTHRVLDIPQDFNEANFIDELDKSFHITELDDANKMKFLEVSSESRLVMFINSQLYGLRIKDSVLDRLHPMYRKVDTYVLQEVIIKGVLGIPEERILNKEGIYFVQTEGEIKKLIYSGNRIGFMLKGVEIDTVREISEGGLVMPQKSTYFYPKLQTGLVLNDL